MSGATRVLQMNQIVRLHAKDDANEIEALGQILQVTNSEIFVTFPDLKELPELFGEGRDCTFKTWDQSGLHLSKTKILRPIPGDKITVAIPPPAEYETMQNRKFFRIQAKVPLVFSVTKSTVAQNMTRKNVRVTTEDISAGGARLETNVPLIVGDEIMIDLTIRPADRTRKADIQHLASKVLRVVTISANIPRKFVIGIEFQNVVERERDRLMRFLFELQRTLPVQK